MGGVTPCWNNLSLCMPNPHLPAFIVFETSAFIRTDGQTDMASSTRLVILIKNIVYYICRGFTRIVLCFRLLFVLDQMETFSGAWHLFSLAPQIRMPSLTACVPFCQRRFLLYSTLAFAFQYTHYWELSVIPFWCWHLHQQHRSTWKRMGSERQTKVDIWSVVYPSVRFLDH